MTECDESFLRCRSPGSKITANRKKQQILPFDLAQGQEDTFAKRTNDSYSCVQG